MRLTEAQRLLAQVQFVSKLIASKKATLDPTSYGLPPLLFDRYTDETDQEFRTRRELAVIDVVENHLFFIKDGERREIILIPEMVRFLTDLFYGYKQRGILWKGRGCGGSLIVAVLIWLCMVYKHMSFTDLAGSGEQAKQVYNYTLNFWEAKPGLKQSFLNGDPLISETRTNGGATLRCASCSQTAVRGKHTTGLVLDEACQDNDAGGDVFRAALQGPLSEENHLIVILSTFHQPTGFFADHWHGAKELGYEQYRWTIYDTLYKCTEPIDCYTECPLTRLEHIHDNKGETVGSEWVGCMGRARNHTRGYASRWKCLEIMKLNKGTMIWACEYECQLPGGVAKVIPDKAIEEACVTEVVLPPTASEWRVVVGIDWGIASQMVAVFILRCADYLAVLSTAYYTGQLTATMIEALKEWEVEFGLRRGQITVYPDSSHPFNNGDLVNAGFDVMPVNFKQWKELGYKNLQRAFAHSKLKLLHSGEGSLGKGHQLLVTQLKKLRRDRLGKIVKMDDHGPDALMAGCLAFPIIDEFPDIHVLDESENGNAKADEDVLMI